MYCVGGSRETNTTVYNLEYLHFNENRIKGQNSASYTYVQHNTDDSEK